MFSDSTDASPLPSSELTLADVSMSRGAVPIFAALSVSVTSRNLLWVGGDNGIGKSSLLRLMSGLSRADSGHISWAVNGRPCPPTSVIAYQGHQDAFKPALTAAEALSFWADILDRGIDVGALLYSVGLQERADVPCGQLSAGQKRRLSLARLILSQKPIWILDEPTAAMDAAGVDLIHARVAAHIQAGGSAIIASHKAPVIAALNTRQLILKAPS